MKKRCAGGLRTPVSRAIRTEAIARWVTGRPPVVVALFLLIGFVIASRGSNVDGIITASPIFLDHTDCQTMSKLPLPVEKLSFSFGDRQFEIKAEIVREAPQLTQGYMCRSEITGGTGMWFQLPTETNRGFWMYNTYVPLDIIYFDASDVAVGAVTLLPCPRSTDEQDNIWRNRCASEAEQFSAGDRPHINVLELPAGWLASQGFGLNSAPENLTLRR